ncbi:MAG: hypothetical protein WC006_08380 [Bacilli bacterium]|nr:hypothetical protein [Bacilli bacterium]
MNINKLLPFLDDESLSLYLEKVKEGKLPAKDLVKALPFLNKTHIKEVYTLIQEQKLDLSLEALLPFMDDDVIEDMYEKVLNNEITNIDEEAILPFLSEEKIKSLFKKYLENL